MSVSEERPPTPAQAAPIPPKLLYFICTVCFLIFAALTVVKAVLPLKPEPKVEANLISELQELKLADAVPASKDWPQWRGPNRDGVSGDTGLLLDWPDSGPRRAWEKPLGKGFSSIVVADKRAYTFFQYQKDEAAICWDAETGTELWRFRYAADYHNGFGDGPRSTPSIDGDYLFTVGGTGVMHCLRTNPKSAEGEVVWRKDLLPEFGASNIQWGISFSPLVVGNLVFIMPGGPAGNSVAALDKHTGAVVWKALDDQAGYSSPIAVNAAGQDQILFFTALGLAALTPDTGTLLWRFPWTTENNCNIATPIFFQDYVFISSGYQHGCALLKITKSGDMIQARAAFENARMRNHFSSSVRYQDHVYGYDDILLTCLDLRSGNVAWKDDRTVEKGSLLLADGHLLILGQEGNLVVAKATPAKFDEKCRFELPRGRYWTVPTLAQGRLYIRNEKKIMCFDMKR